MNEPEVYHRMTITRLGDGRATIHHETNDDDDDGYDDGHTEVWEDTVASVERALRITGVTRVGVSGVRVLVTLDGEEVR